MDWITKTNYQKALIGFLLSELDWKAKLAIWIGLWKLYGTSWDEVDLKKQEIICVTSNVKKIKISKTDTSAVETYWRNDDAFI